MTGESDQLFLVTKVLPPPLREDLVLRPRLTAKLDGLLEHSLALLTAPAGFGKTTLLRAWAAHAHQRVGWLSLEKSDNSATRFWFYFIQAVRQVMDGFGEDLLAMLSDPSQPRMEVLLTRLLNQIGSGARRLILILDDYHEIEAPEIHSQLQFLIDHMPPRLHLAIAGRERPSLGLGRLRAQDQLVELEAADLRFTALEADRFLNGVMKLDLSPEERVTLETRTEGWVAGLQLAALSLQGRADKSGFLSAFAGDDRYVRDYFFEEVFRRQPPVIQAFLLKTSLVERFCGSLCDTLTGGEDGQTTIERLDQAHLFVVPLSDQREWYRYHHLFLDLLRSQLQRWKSEDIPGLHRRASEWFSTHGMPHEAIHHALAGEDFAAAADLISAYMQGTWVRADMHSLLEWMQALPEPVLRSRPRLELGYAWLLLELYSDRWDLIKAHLTNVARALEDNERSEESRPEEARLMRAEVDLLWANHARAEGDFPAVIARCQAAIDRLPAGETYLRSGLIAHLASGYESLGEVRKADSFYAESLAMCRAAGNIDGLLFAAARAIESLAAGGQLRKAQATFQAILPFLDERSGPDKGLVYIHIGEVFREINDLEKAAEHLQRGLAICEPFEGWRAGVVAGCLSLARVRAAQGDYEGAQSLLAEAENWGEWSKTPQAAGRVGAIRARLALERGEYSAAASWAVSGGLAAADALSYALEVDHLTLVRVLIAQAALEMQSARPAQVSPRPLEDAAHLLSRLEEAASAGGRGGRLVEIGILHALLNRVRGKTDQALSALEGVLNRAEPEGYVRVFLEEGEPLRQLLANLVTRPASLLSQGYVERLLALYPGEPGSIQSSGLVAADRLTKREREALYLLATDLTVEEIALEMSVAASTVRTYAKRIYNKLGVHSRAEAVYRAKALGWL